jgi:hypothetical protein
VLAADYAFAAAIVFVIGCNLYFSPRIRRDRIAMQWGLDGKPTWSAPKWFALWGMVGFMLAVRWSIWLATIYTPRLVHGAGLGILIFSGVFAVTHLFTLKTAVKKER